LRDLLRPGDVVAMMGAGNISAVAHGLAAALTGATGARVPFERRRS
jgi:hypothetical protein